MASFIKNFLSAVRRPASVVVSRPLSYCCVLTRKFLELCFYFSFFLSFSGDRIISVNGESVSGKSYAEVVSLIQRLRDNLSLIVVPKQDDILQMVRLAIYAIKI